MRSFCVIIIIIVMPRHSKASRRSKEQRKRVQGRRFAAESGDLDSLVLDSEDESDPRRIMNLLLKFLSSIG